MHEHFSKQIQKDKNEFKQAELYEKAELLKNRQDAGPGPEDGDAALGDAPFEAVPKEARKKTVSGMVGSLFHRKDAVAVGDDKAGAQASPDQQEAVKLDLEHIYTEQYEEVHEEEMGIYSYLEQDLGEKSKILDKISDKAKEMLEGLKIEMAVRTSQVEDSLNRRKKSEDAVVFFADYEKELLKVNEEKEGTTIYDRHKEFVAKMNAKYGLKEEDHQYLEVYAKMYRDTQGDLSLDEINDAKSKYRYNYTRSEEKFRMKETFKLDFTANNGVRYTKQVGGMREIKKPLFPSDPTPHDVRQGNAGDCYFISAINAIVEKDPKLIKSMMRDNGDTVTVRFYNPDGKPVYVTVKKTLPDWRAVSEDGKIENSLELEGAGNAGAALWVCMIEKAFAAVRPVIEPNGDFRETAKDNVYKEDNQYAALRKGSTVRAIQVLLGKKYRVKTRMNLTEESKSMIGTSIQGHKLSANMLSDEKEAYAKELKSQGKKLDKVQWNIKKAELFFGVKVKDANDELYKFFSNDAIFKNIQSHIRQALEKDFTSKTLKTTNDGLAMVEYLEKEVEKMPKIDIPGYDDAKMKEHYLGYLKNYVLKTKRLTQTINKTGVYTSREKKIYDKLKKTSDEKKLIFASTVEFSFARKEKRGLSLGERVKFGVADSHGYNVRGVSEEERMVGGKKVVQKFVTIVNPWKDVIRQYDADGNPYLVQNTEKGDYDTGGAYKMELRDFITTFSGVDF